MKYRHGFLFSMLLHLLIILTMVRLYWLNDSHAGTRDVILVKSYLYATKLTGNASHLAKKALSNVTKKNQQATKQILVANKSILKHVSKMQSTATQDPTANLTQGNYDQLLLALHNAIAIHQEYPENAQLLQQQGTTIVSFELHSSGEITNISIKHSSGFALLDNAAISAIQQTSPFTTIRIKHTTQLQLAISFNLPNSSPYSS